MSKPLPLSHLLATVLDTLEPFGMQADSDERAFGDAKSQNSPNRGTPSGVTDEDTSQRIARSKYPYLQLFG